MAGVMHDQIDAVDHKDLRRHDTAESIFLPISRDAFEKLYLDPKLPREGKLYRKFGNPTPVALMGFMIAGFPTGCILMGWRGSGGNGGAILYESIQVVSLLERS